MPISSYYINSIIFIAILFKLNQIIIFDPVYPLFFHTTYSYQLKIKIMKRMSFKMNYYLMIIISFFSHYFSLLVSPIQILPSLFAVLMTMNQIQMKIRRMILKTMKFLMIMIFISF